MLKFDKNKLRLWGFAYIVFFVIYYIMFTTDEEFMFDPMHAFLLSVVATFVFLALLYLLYCLFKKRKSKVL